MAAVVDVCSSFAQNGLQFPYFQSRYPAMFHCARVDHTSALSRFSSTLERALLSSRQSLLIPPLVWVSPFWSCLFFLAPTSTAIRVQGGRRSGWSRARRYMSNFLCSGFSQTSSLQLVTVLIVPLVVWDISLFPFLAMVLRKCSL
ncbi:hypothetical protein IWX90DRAFT_107942 [Phyllosticta citrichinensis]|uniref:Uncharacterized protein n=1 Tax=Phyllosticta citrichinensis TaxID=1130410 RepID=A0ABR1Y2G5_9PEZI